MSDDVPSLAEAMAEIRQPSSLLTINHVTRRALEILSMPEAEFNRRNEMELEAEIERLRARVAELEAAAAITFGTLGTDTARAYGTLAPSPADMPTVYTHNVPPSAPPHDQPRTAAGEELSYDVPPVLPPGRFVRGRGDPSNDE